MSTTPTLSFSLAALLSFIFSLSGGGNPNALLVITLNENPTTGYVWSYTMDKEGVIEETADDYNTDSNLNGAPGKHTWQFAPLKDGTVTLTFTLSRPWETDSAPEQTKTFTYEVKGKVITEKTKP